MQALAKRVWHEVQAHQENKTALINLVKIHPNILYLWVTLDDAGEIESCNVKLAESLDDDFRDKDGILWPQFEWVPIDLSKDEITAIYPDFTFTPQSDNFGNVIFTP